MFKYLQVVDDVRFPVSRIEESIEETFVITEIKPTTIVFRAHHTRAFVAQFIDNAVPQVFRLYLNRNTFVVKAPRASRQPAPQPAAERLGPDLRHSRPHRMGLTRRRPSASVG